MGQKSSIDRLPKEVREKVGELRRDGATIKEIVKALEELGIRISKSAMGRHTQRLDVIAKHLNESRGIAEGLFDRLGGDGGDSGRLARVNVHLAHSLLLKLMVNEEGETIEVNTKEARFLTGAIKDLVSAESTTASIEAKERERARKEAAESAAAAMQEAGMSADQVRFWREEYLGVRPAEGA